MLNAYRNYLIGELNLSPLTVTYYLQTLRRFSEFLLPKPLYEASRSDMTNYLSELATTDLKGGTRSKAVASLKSFFSWLYGPSDLLTGTSPARDLKAPKRHSYAPRPIPMEEFKELLRKIYATDMPPHYKLMFLLLVDTGRRITEISSIQCKNIHFDEAGFITIYLMTKGAIEHAVVVMDCDFSYPLLCQMRGRLEAQEDVYLFSHTGSQPLSYKAIHRAWNSHVTNLYTLHQVRHTIATFTANHSLGSIELAQMTLGHASAGTTMRYAKMGAGWLVERSRSVREAKRDWLVPSGLVVDNETDKLETLALIGECYEK